MTKKKSSAKKRAAAEKKGSDQHQATSIRRRRTTRGQKHHLQHDALASVRAVKEVRACVYSYLSVKDLVRLGGVDKTFYNDEQRGQVVGIYGGYSTWEIGKAFEKVREYLEFKGTPDSATVLGNSPCCWGTILCEIFDADQGDWLYDQIHSFFKVDEDEGCGQYNLEGIDKHFDGLEYPLHKEQKAKLMEELDYVNWYISENHWKLSEMDEIERMLRNAPFNALFDLLKEYDIDPYPYLKAEEPPIYGFSDEAYEIKKGNSSWYLSNLSPGRKFIFRDAVGKIVEKVLMPCDNCKKIRDDVTPEGCMRKYCLSGTYRCRDCTTVSECSTCGEKGCKCYFQCCCHPGCENSMCTAYNADWADQHDTGSGYGCGFVCYPDGVEPGDDNAYEAERKKYCIEHKPEGAVRAPPYW